MYSCKSYAKINIALNVVGRTKNNYHLLDSVVLPIELHDTIIVENLKKGVETYVTVDDFSQGSIEYNIASFAIDRMAALYGFNNKFRVYIHKVIPMQAGLGGGSSNAAFTMKAVRKILKLDVSDEELTNIAKTLGADVPFFIKCQPARMRGIGEILNPINVKNNYYVLIVKPHDGLSTKMVFDRADEMLLKTGDIETVIKALETGDDDLLANSIVNSLEEPAVSFIPEIRKIMDVLRAYGVKIVGMTGSGSSVVGMSTDKKLLKKIALEIEDDYDVELTKVLK